MSKRSTISECTSANLTNSSQSIAPERSLSASPNCPHSIRLAAQKSTPPTPNPHHTTRASYLRKLAPTCAEMHCSGTVERLEQLTLRDGAVGVGVHLRANTQGSREQQDGRVVCARVPLPNPHPTRTAHIAEDFP